MPLVAGNDVTMTCVADVGRPAGTLTWLRVRDGGISVTVATSSDDIITENAVVNDNGTTTIVSKLKVKVAESDDGTVYRCTASAAVGTTISRWAEYQLQVQCKNTSLSCVSSLFSLYVMH